MKRAAEAARKLAEQTGAELVVGKFYFDGFYEGGNLVVSHVETRG
jgi:hypothetical protein